VRNSPFLLFLSLSIYPTQQLSNTHTHLFIPLSLSLSFYLCIVHTTLPITYTYSLFLQEHAVLLCNYAIWIERKRGGHASIYVARGYAVPQGNVCFVVIRDQKGTTIWDPTTSRSYDVSDQDAPLKSIHSLLGIVDASNPDTINLWANVAEETAPWEIDFDVSNRSCWDPLHRDKAHRLKSIQEAELPYRVTDESFVVETDALIEREVRKHLRNWRSKEYRLTTEFNHTVCRALKKLLPDMEAVRVGMKEKDEERHLKAIKRLSDTHDVFGFPLHSNFTDARSIVKKIRDTHLHSCLVKGAQFGVATMVVGYTNTVCSVWVYLALLIPR